MDTSLKFQVLDWREYHDIDDDNNEIYKIRLFGRTKDDRTVYVEVKNFNPFFYVEIPKEWKQHKINIFINSIKETVSERYRESLKEWDIVKRYTLYKFL